MITVCFAIYLFLIIIQRITEMRISKRNEKILIQKGAVEFGKPHFKFLIMLHTLVFISMVIEYSLKAKSIELTLYNVILFSFVVILQAFRFSTIKSLGNYWTIRIYRVPGEPLIKTGLYKYLKHPIYIIVILEIIIIPLVFNLYLTSIIFTILNLIAITVRITVENKALNT
jgi:methyltransferase